MALSVSLPGQRGRRWALVSSMREGKAKSMLSLMAGCGSSTMIGKPRTAFGSGPLRKGPGPHRPEPKRLRSCLRASLSAR
eukprot:11605667-Alexandrium_andersonii.AAC.1